MKLTETCTLCGDSMTVDSGDVDFAIGMAQAWDVNHRKTCTGTTAAVTA